MKINLLDCTLREAPIKDLILGSKYIQKFINALEESNIDIIECGFLKNIEHNPNSTIFKHTEEIEYYLQNKRPDKLYVALVDYGRYDLKYLSPYNGKSIDGIRICFKKEERYDVFDYAKAIQEKGYKVFFQNVDTLSYSDFELLEMIEKVNELKPYAYSIVDTFGSMYADNVRHLFFLVSKNLHKDIILGFHAHNNMMLANSNTQEFVNIAHRRKEINIDASVLGCGRGAGNAHTELLAEFLNKFHNTNYGTDVLLDIIDYLMPKFIEECKWGYSIPYFLSGIHSSHVFNVNHLLKRHNINSKDLRAIIEKLGETEKKAYDYKLLEKTYVEYFNKEVDDKKTLNELKNNLENKQILCLLPGLSLKTEQEKIKNFVEKEKPVIISINNYIEGSDYTFFSNAIRYQEYLNNNKSSKARVILTSNIKQNANENEMIINYLPLIKFGWINLDNSAVMILRLFIKLGLKTVSFAGFDGFNEDAETNYYDNNLISTKNTEDLMLLTKETKEMLLDIKNSIKINLITKSLYSEVLNKEVINV